MFWYMNDLKNDGKIVESAYALCVWRNVQDDTHERWNTTMPDIRTRTESMQTAAGQFATQSVQLADLITQVGKDISQLQDMWQGPAATTFATMMAQWHTDVSGIQQVLEEVGQKVQNAGIGYGDLDDQIRRGFQTY